MIKNMNEAALCEGVSAIVLLSHGPLALSLIASAKQILGEGETESLIALCLEDADNAKAYGDELMKIIEAIPKGSLLLFDLFGGTPCNQYCEKGIGRGMFALTGVNLGMLLEALSERESLSGEELFEAVLEAGRAGVVNLRQLEEAAR